LPMMSDAPDFVSRDDITMYGKSDGTIARAHISKLRVTDSAASLENMRNAAADIAVKNAGRYDFSLDLIILTAPLCESVYE